MLNVKIQIPDDMKELLRQSFSSDSQKCCAYFPDIKRNPSVISSFGIQSKDYWLELYQESDFLEDGEYYSRLVIQKKQLDNNRYYKPHNNILWERYNDIWLQAPLIGSPFQIADKCNVRKDERITFQLQGYKTISIIHDSISYILPVKNEIHHIEADIGILIETPDCNVVFSICDKDFTYSLLLPSVNDLAEPVVFWSLKTDQENCYEAERTLIKIN